MLKVLKFGGSSLADARQFAKVKSIVEADPARRAGIGSQPGKRLPSRPAISSRILAQNGSCSPALNTK